MAESTTPRRRRRAKTWSELGDLGRKPTDYEIVTHGMNHTMTEQPLELGPDVNGNVWLREHRDNMAFVGVDFEGFRDPDEMTYERYVTRQDEAETFIDGVIERFEADDGDGSSPELVAYQQRTLAPTRYLAHGLQMLSAYVQQLAPSAYVGNCASFQAADLIRRIQRTAERTKMLQLAHPDAGFGTGERELWEGDDDWQPFRRIVEEAMLVYDWDRALVATQLVIKPLCDLLTLDESATQVRLLGGELDALVLENLALDAARSRRWSAALANHIIAADDGNAGVITGYLNEWLSRASDVTAAGSRLLAVEGGRSATDIADGVTEAWQGYLTEAGLAPVAANR